MCLIFQPREKLKYSLLEGGLSPAPPSSMLDGSADGVSPEGRAFFSQSMFANIELGGDGGQTMSEGSANTFGKNYT